MVHCPVTLVGPRGCCIPIVEEKPTLIVCDNESVVKNSSLVESTLNKKHNSIAYHLTRWAVAAKEITIGWVESGQNLADGLTKRIYGELRDHLFGNWTY